VGVQGHPVDVAARVIHPTDPIPPLTRLDERLLRELLRVVPVPRDQVHRTKEGLVLGVEELVEGRRRYIHGTPVGDLVHRL